MKNFGKELKKIKRLTKKDLKQFTPERVINDLNIIDELMNNMIKRLSINLREGVQKEFKDFFTNKYN